MKKYFTIGEVAELCQLKAHVLRYWEQEFPELEPAKRKGSRRYYQEKDIEMIQKIRELLYDKGMTIPGARKLLSNKKSAKLEKSSHSAVRINLAKLRADLELVLGELKALA